MVCCDDKDGNGDDKHNQDNCHKNGTDGDPHDRDEQGDPPLTSCPSPPLRTPVTLSSSPSYVMSKSSRVAPRTSTSYYHPDLSSQLGHSRRLSHVCSVKSTCPCAILYSSTPSVNVQPRKPSLSETRLTLKVVQD